MPTAPRLDIVVIGGGIAGASIGHWLAPHARVVVLEREDAARLPLDRPLGGAVHGELRHAAGARADDGEPGVLRAPARRLRRAADPDAARRDDGRRHGQEAQLDAHWQVLRRSRRAAACSIGARPARWCRCCARERVLGAVYEPDATDMDVHAMHQGYLRGMRRAGGQVVCDAEVDALRRVGAASGRCRPAAATTQRRCVVNAAGAWADAVARARRRGADRAGAAAPLGVHLRAARRRRQRRAGR